MKMARTNTRKKVNKKKTTKATMEMKATVAPKPSDGQAGEELAFDLTKQTTKADWEAFKKNDFRDLKVGEGQLVTVLMKISNQLAKF